MLVVAEIALALVLLAGAGLMGRSLLASLQKDVGVRLDRTLVLSLSPSTTRYAEKRQLTELYRRVLEQVNAVPGTAGTALTDTFLFSWADRFNFILPGQNPDDPATQKQNATEDSVSPETFRTLGIPLRRGRLFDAHDRTGAPWVMVVNETFARRFLPAGEVVGQHLTLKGKALTDFEIVGVVGDVRRDGLNAAAPAAAYFCYLQRPSSYVALYVRAAGGLNPESLTKPVEEAIWRIDPDQAIGRVQTLQRAASASVAYVRLYTALFAVFAGLTLALAALGIYGTIAYSVSQLTREIGIRLALGAQRGDVQRLVLWQGVRLVTAGLVLGVGTALALAHLMTSLLYGIKPNDPATLAAVALVLGGVALLASWLPARKAAHIDPLTALREE
jgi:putative ABC transport system permease protein